MREIKFRAWTGESMTDVIRLESAHGIRLVSSSDLAPHEMSDDKVVFMQYTGLKDKNGKEIYEGDIVQTKWKVVEKESWNTWEKVACPQIAPGSFHWYSEFEDMVVEVIGNIYENPELIK